MNGKTFPKTLQQVEQSSMGHHSLEPLQGSMETFDPRENWTHFGQQLVMVRSLTPSRCRTLKLEVWDVCSSESYLILVLFSTQAQFLNKFFSTQKHVNRDKTDLRQKCVNCDKTNFTTKKHKFDTCGAGWHNLRGVLTSWFDPEFGPQNAYVEILATFATKMP